MTSVILKPHQENRILSGHPWIFNTQIAEINGSFKPADIIDIKSHHHKFLGRGYINPQSRIQVRVLTRQDEPINNAFFISRLKDAIDFRKKIISKDTNAYRLVFSESDFLPGLIVDAYADYLVIQTLTLGMDKWRNLITDILKQMLRPKGIYMRNDVPVRRLEGLNLEKGVLYGKFSPRQEVRENGIKFFADLENGHKTGLYIDQRENRFFFRYIAKDKEVLDCFCYNGGFTTYAAAYGARRVLGLDISMHALELAKANMKLNRIDARIYEFKQANVFDELRLLSKQEKRFDIIILDPPSFTRSKDKIEGALRGYREINLRAMKLLKAGGVLVSANCSYHIDEQVFKQVIQEAACDVRRVIRLIKWGRQAADHPILLNIKETFYLKCLFAQVL